MLGLVFCEALRSPPIATAWRLVLCWNTIKAALCTYVTFEKASNKIATLKDVAYISSFYRPTGSLHVRAVGYKLS